MPLPRPRGRPKGSRTTPKEGHAAELSKTVKDVYEIIKHLLTPEQQRYYKEAFSGRQPFDPLRHSEFFMLLYSVYASDILVKAINDGKVSQDIAFTLREFRMGMKDVEDMQRARDKVADKNGNDGRVVDPTREPKMGVLESLLRGDSKG